MHFQDEFKRFRMASKHSKYAPMVYALFVVVILPYIHIGIVHLKFWVPDKPPVDKGKCTCSCFDTVFKGSYEQPGKTGYKHIYFNATSNTFKIWVLTVVFMLMLYESLKRLFTLFRASRLKYGWAFLFLANIYPHYYSWWNFFGYYNDEFYSIFHHQLFFCITELCVSLVVVNMCDANTKCQSWKLLMILSVSLVHIVVSSWDQFFTNVLKARGASFQNSRDFGLMIPDICHVIFATCQYWKFYLSKDSHSHCPPGTRRIELASFVALTLCLTYIPVLL